MADFGREWRFNPADRDWLAHDGQPKKTEPPFWGMPRRLVGDASAGANDVLRAIWRAGRTGPSAVSILPVLALHTWPTKKARSEATQPPGPGWTPYHFLPKERIARLAGVNRDTVRDALDLLQGMELVRLTEIRLPTDAGGRLRQHYSLSTGLYRVGNEPTTALPWRLFYAGRWAVLPFSACRQLLLAIACLDPIRDEDAFLEKQLETHGGDVAALDDDERAERLAGARRTRPMSHAALMEATGIASKPDIVRALEILRTPPGAGRAPATPAYLVSGDAGPRGRSRWYAVDRRIVNWNPDLNLMNDRLPQLRYDFWRNAVGAPVSRLGNLPPPISRAA